MFNVLIVDDEIFVVSLIEKLIDWESLDMRIVDTANDGVEALEKVQLLHPDIVIVDVRMPGYDGITFMQKVREINDKIRFIVISGHKKFEYAKSAMQYNVEDYLLKPINKKELEGILIKLKNKLESERQNEQTMQLLDNQLGVSKTKLRDYLLEQLLVENKKIIELPTAQLNETYFTKFKDEIYQYAVFVVDSEESNVDSSFLEKLMGRLMEGIEQYLENGTYDYLVQIQGNTILYLLNYATGQQEWLIKQMHQLLNHILLVLEKFEKLYITVGVGEQEHLLCNTRRSYLTAHDSLDSRLALGVNRIIEYQHVRQDEGTLRVIFSDVQNKKLMDAIKSLNSEKVALQIKELFSRADEYKYANTCIYQQVGNYIFDAFYQYITQVHIYKGTYEEWEAKLIETSPLCGSSRALSKRLIQYISSFIEEYVRENEGGENPAVRIAKRYIAENYQNNISMTSVADVVHLSSVYFSILFKKEVGVNFLDYLNQYRIDISKKLLKDVQYNVNEVASMSGFQDARYFSKIFKKTVGITPTEYRNRNV